MLLTNNLKNDNEFRSAIADDILNTTYISSGEKSDKFACVFVEGRESHKQINKEEMAALVSMHIFSEYNYPKFLFVNKNNIDTFLGNYLGRNELEKAHNIQLIPIEPINSWDEVNYFYKYSLPKLIPSGPDNLLFYQADGYLMKKGWEQFVLDNDFDYIGAHWRHLPRIKMVLPNRGEVVTKPNYCGNGGFSFRKRHVLNIISSNFKNQKYPIDEFGAENKPAPEDLFFSNLGLNTGVIRNQPTLKQCDEFCVDPLTPEAYNRKVSFGFHCPKAVSEWPECNHG